MNWASQSISASRSYYKLGVLNISYYAGAAVLNTLFYAYAVALYLILCVGVVLCEWVGYRYKKFKICFPNEQSFVRQAGENPTQSNEKIAKNEKTTARMLKCWFCKHVYCILYIHPFHTYTTALYICSHTPITTTLVSGVLISPTQKIFIHSFVCWTVLYSLS